ncbi:MAG: helix-turn-helix domain-containing protein [Acidobacteria bacterium]|nr:helix-turn-helix domain-containing protein [Acidobacteriota bacterium]
MIATATKRRPTQVKINAEHYAQLLAAVRPSVIGSEAEYERVNTEINQLLKKGARLSPEENRLLELLTWLVAKYDDEHYQIPDAAAHEVIQFLMEERGLRNKDLEPLLGSRGVTSEVINGKRKPSKPQIKALAEFFQVKPTLFLSLD